MNNRGLLRHKKKETFNWEILQEIEKTPNSTVETLMERWGLGENNVVAALQFLGFEVKYDRVEELPITKIPKSKKLTLVQAASILDVDYKLVHDAVFSGDLPVQRPNEYGDFYWVNVDDLRSLQEKLSNGGLSQRRKFRSEKLKEEGVFFSREYLRRDSFPKFIQEVFSVPLLSPDEEKELLMKVKEGDEVAVQDLMEANSRLVISRAIRHCNVSPILDLTDLFQEGMLGLQRAILDYNFEFEAKLSTYAMYWINQSILRAIVDNKETVRIPVPVYDRRAKITKFAIEFVHQFGREPTDKEVSENLGLILTHVRSDRKYLHGKSISLDDVVYEDGQKTYHDIFPDTKSKNPRDLMDKEYEEFMFLRVLDSLEESERNKKMLRDRFGFNKEGKEHTLEEIAEKSYYKEKNISRERVRKITDKLLNKIGAIIDLANGEDIYSEDYVPLAKRVELSPVKYRKNSLTKKDKAYFIEYGIPVSRNVILGGLDEKLTRENALAVITRIDAPPEQVNIFLDRFGLNESGEYVPVEVLKRKYYYSSSSKLCNDTKKVLDRFGIEMDKQDGIDTSSLDYIPYSQRLNWLRFGQWVASMRKNNFYAMPKLVSDDDAVEPKKPLEYRRFYPSLD